MTSFKCDYQKGKVGESEFYKRLTRHVPNSDWKLHNDRDTDVRSKTQGTIEVKSERSQSIKIGFIHEGRIHPNEQFFCINYARPWASKEYKEKGEFVRRGVFKTIREAAFWAEKVGCPAKCLYVKQWFDQRIVLPNDPSTYYKVPYISVFYHPETLAKVREWAIDNTFKIFAHNYSAQHSESGELEYQDVPAEFGVKKFWHGKKCPHYKFATEGTHMCRVVMDMEVVFAKMAEFGHPVKFTFEEGLAMLKDDER